MKAIKIIAIAIICAILFTGAASATKIVKNGYEIKLYTDAGVYKSRMYIPGLLDYEFKNNMIYTITASEFRTYDVSSGFASQKYYAKGNYWDIDLVSGISEGSVFLGTVNGAQQLKIAKATGWKPTGISAVYKPALTIKSVVADSGGVKLYSLDGQRFQYFWKSDGFLILTDAWL